MLTAFSYEFSISTHGIGTYEITDQINRLVVKSRTKTGVATSIPIADGKLQLGTWQGLFVYEHRHGPMQRRLSVSVIGESG